MFAAFSLLLALAMGHELPCVVSKNEFTWDFSVWAGQKASVTSGMFNIPPMHGEWTYDVDFCKSITLTSKDTGFGWDYGELLVFTPHTHYIPPLNETYDVAFELEYGMGDAGPPCIDQNRAAITELFCDEKLDCTRFPGSSGPNCLAGDAKTGFCVCGVNFTHADPEISPLCQGMIIYLLSHNCPPGKLTPINPTPKPHGPSVPGIVFLVLFLLIVVGYVGGVFYNYFVHGARGVETLPLYATCCGQQASNSVQYHPEDFNAANKAGGSYGSV